MAVKHALIVDDSRSARVMLRKMLEKNNLQVDQCESGDEALSYLENSKPDIIFMDHMMPGMDGLQATSIITQNPATASIPVVMYTSKEGPEYLEEAKAHGAVDILPKPANWPLIKEILQRIESGAVVPGATTAGTQAATAAIDEDSLAAMVEQVVARTLEEKLEALIDAALEQRLEPLEDKIFKRCETAIADASDALLDQMADQENGVDSTGIEKLIEDKLSATSEGLDEEAVNKLIESRLSGDAFKDIQLDLEDKISALENSIAEKFRIMDTEASSTLDDAQIQEIKSTLEERLLESSRHEAEMIAREISTAAVNEAATQLSKDTAYLVAKDISAQTEPSIKLAYQLSALAAIMGVAAAAVVYFVG